ncbi:MAG: S8 family serine peptidase [Planctomycetaceae bacterium]|nr:S8 family serine peptidase [Planctomycetaceae bacterium]
MGKLIPCLLRSLLVFASLFLGDSGLFAETWEAVPKHCPNKRLAPELYAVQQSDAELLGITRHGRAVFRGHENCAHKLRSMSIAVATQTSDVSPKGNRLLISYHSNSGRPSDETLAKAGLRKLEDYRHGSFLIVEPVVTVSAASVNTLLDDSAVLHVAPDYVVSIGQDDFLPTLRAAADAPTPSDPAYADLWGLKNIGAPQAWTVVRETPKVIVAVIDTGVDYNHPDLKANMWTRNGKHGYDFYDDDDDPMDDQDHGTHCSGTIAGVGNNGVGVVGVSWKTQIMALRFMGADGSGTISDAVKCIDWAVANGAHVLSNSWAGQGTSQELVNAVIRAERKGVLFVAAAGNTAGNGNNNDTSPYYPAALPPANVLTVGAIDVNNARASFSHYGVKSVDIGAPGVGIVSTIRNNRYASMDGTSMAAPHVAGAAALVWGGTFSTPTQNPTQMAKVRDLICANARPVAALRNFWGGAAPAKVPGGVLDVSFLATSEPEPPPPTPVPTPSPTPTPTPTTPQPTGIVVASTRFDAGTVNTTTSGMIASAKLSLRQPSVVSVVANSSVRSVGWQTRFATGFSDKPAVEEYWQESIRNPELNRTGGWSTVGSMATANLPAGEHTIYWKVWIDPGASLKFHSGLMLIQAAPLPSAAAQDFATDEKFRTPIMLIKRQEEYRQHQLSPGFR